MNFGNFLPLKNATAYVSADVIVYREEDLAILTSVRQYEPWRGWLCLALGGFIDPTDKDPREAAIREAREESGLDIQLTHFVGIYGPERYRERLRQTSFGTFFAETLPEPATIRPVVSLVFAGKVRGGELKDSDEQKEFKWLDPQEIAKREFVAFDHARALAHWLNNFYSCKRALAFLDK